MPVWGKRKDGQPYVKKPTVRGIKSSVFSEGVTEHRFKKNPILEESEETNEDELEEFAKNKVNTLSYMNQVPEIDFRPVTNETWETIQIEGLNEEQSGLRKSDWVEGELKLEKEDIDGLKAFDNKTIERFNDFDIDLKNRYEMKIIDLINYDSGLVKLVMKK